MMIRHLPLKSCICNSLFGYRELLVNNVYYWWHNGIDLIAQTGTEIFAVADGTIKIVGNNPTGYGIYIVLDSGNFGALYGHLSNANVVVGQKVVAGQMLGLTGNTGASTGAHLHFELRLCEYKNFWDRCANDRNVFMRCIDPLPEINKFMQAQKMSLYEARQEIKNKIGLDDNTMNYLNYYRYAEALQLKIAKEIY